MRRIGGWKWRAARPDDDGLVMMSRADGKKGNLRCA